MSVMSQSSTNSAIMVWCIAAAHFLHPICTFGFLQGKKTDMAKPTKSKAEHCNTLQNTKLPDEKVAALFGLKEPAKNAILSSTGAKALSEKIARRLFCTLRGSFFTAGSAPPGRRAYRYEFWSGGAWCPRGCGWRRRCTGYPSRSAGKAGRTWHRCGTGSR